MDNVENQKDEAFVLEEHLHKQYATNAQSNIGSFIAFLVSILAIFYAFGYVFIFSTNEFSTNAVLFVETNSGHILFTLDVLLLIASISLLILAFLIVYCLNLGWQQRRDHIIVARIREKRMTEQERNDIFKDQYSAEGKSWLTFIPNVFLYFLILFIAVAILVIFMTLNKVCSAISICPLWIFVVSILLLILVVVIGWPHFYKKYRTMCDSEKQSQKL